MSSDEIPRAGRIAAIDYGHVRLGIAVTDETQTIGSPFENYQRKGSEADAEYLRRFVENERIVGFVVGLPLHASGDESQKSLEARRFAGWLKHVTGLPVSHYDERYSSVAAERFLAMGGLTSKQRKKRRDMLAAQIILSAYLESFRDGDQGSDPLAD